jgi:Domain of unknown function (DUF5642)
MRVFASCVAIVLCTACAQPAPPPSALTSDAAPSSSPARLRPARVERVRSDLPDDYEVSDLTGRAAPLALWGFGPAWTADPTQCGALADPAGEGGFHGWSASGPGGIVHAVVAVSPGGLDPASAESCATWTLSAGPTNADVTLVGAPAIDGAVTLGMATDATTVVEGGTETHTHADTFVAYLNGYVAYVTVVTDPGAAGPALRADFASGLLVQTVVAIRG